MTEDEADCLCRALDKTGDGQIRLAALELATAPDGTAKTSPATTLSPPAASPDVPHNDALLAAQRALAAAASSPLGSPVAGDPTSTNGLPDEAADPFERFHERSGPAATGDTQPPHQPAIYSVQQPQPYAPDLAPPSRSRPPSAAKREGLRSFGELSARVRTMRTDWDGELPHRAGSPLRSTSPEHRLIEGSRMSMAASSCGRRSSLGGSLGGAESFSSKDVASLPDRLASLLVKNHARVIDLFRSWDDDEGACTTTHAPRRRTHAPEGGHAARCPPGALPPPPTCIPPRSGLPHQPPPLPPDGCVSRAEFGRGLRELGLDKKTSSAELDELFATLDVNGDGSIAYEELHRMLRVGSAARMSEYLRDASRGSPPIPENEVVARDKWKGPRAVEVTGAAGKAVLEDEWPASLRVLLMRERKRVVDLFRHWEGGEDGAVSIEHFKAGLYVLGHQATRSHVSALFKCMGAVSPDSGPESDLRLPFRELRRQLRVAAQRGSSGYLRAAARLGAVLEAASPRGGLLCELDASALPQPDPRTMELSQALGFSSPGYSTPAVDLETAHQFGLATGAFGRSGTDMGGGVVGLGAFASSARDRSRAAAEIAAEAAATPGRQAVHSAEMMMQQWARTHYSSLLTELRKWELRPDGEVSFDAFADSLVSLGFPTVGKWQEIESVWYSWEPTAAGTHHWLRLRAHLTGGRMVKVQQKKQTVALYYKQASRAGEGFGNRSSPRFRDANPTLIGPGKYKPEGAAAPVSVGNPPPPLAAFGPLPSASVATPLDPPLHGCIPRQAWPAIRPRTCRRASPSGRARWPTRRSASEPSSQTRCRGRDGTNPSTRSPTRATQSAEPGHKAGADPAPGGGGARVGLVE